MSQISGSLFANIRPTVFERCRWLAFGFAMFLVMLNLCWLLSLKKLFDSCQWFNRKMFTVSILHTGRHLIILLKQYTMPFANKILHKYRKLLKFDNDIQYTCWCQSHWEKRKVVDQHHVNKMFEISDWKGKET